MFYGGILGVRPPTCLPACLSTGPPVCRPTSARSADLSGQLLDNHLALEWGRRILEEFRLQARFEANTGLPRTTVASGDLETTIKGQHFFAEKVGLSRGFVLCSPHERTSGGRGGRRTSRIDGLIAHPRLRRMYRSACSPLSVLVDAMVAAFPLRSAWAIVAALFFVTLRWGQRSASHATYPHQPAWHSSGVSFTSRSSVF